MGNAPRQFVCVTNIPSSYRLYEFELLNEALAERDIQFEVIFMAETESGRHWRFRPGDWSFRSRVAPGVHPTWRTMTFHFNPGILTSLIHRPPTWLLLGGGWNVPTVAMIPVSARASLRHTWLLFWVEATLSYSKYSRRGLSHSLKRTVLSPFDAFVVPGQCSTDYVQELFNGRAKPCIKLANFVDEREFELQVAELYHRRNNLRSALGIGEETVLLWPARLIPEKGILEFLSAISDLPQDRFRILIAGDGSLRESVQTLLSERSMRHVTLLGHQDQPRLLELFTASDMLLLPSLREPYGFVAVEALWAGLPLLLSERVGAIPEVLIQRENGWCFDPYDREQTVQVVIQALATERANLAKMGMRSRDIAKERFDGRTAVRSFVDSLLDLLPPMQS